MIREVYIDNKIVDVNNDSDVGYIFNSPIFRDITKIIANRTTTYKIPKTDRNIKVIGLSDSVDIDSLFPYRKHTIEEYRNGLPFIKGVCTLLSTTENEFELSVIWGNTINLLSLKDLKLRELSGTQYVEWNDKSQFLLSSSTDQYGFIYVDYGKGFANFKYLRPSITIQGILDIITSSQNVKFEYPDKFTEIFNKTWIPLLDTNLGQINRDNYTTVATCIGTYDSVTNHGQELNLKANYIQLEAFGKNNHNVIQDKSVFIDFDCNLICNYPIKFHSESPRMENGRYMDCLIDFVVYGNEEMEPIRLQADQDGFYVGACTYSADSITNNIRLYPRVRYIDGDGNLSSIGSLVIDFFGLEIRPYPENITFGEEYPIIENLPDLTVINFLKELMQMYGLFAYYDYSRDDSAIQFISIDDMYSYKDHALDWSDKLVNTNRGKFNLSYTYSDYAQINYLKYESDSDVSNYADGVLNIDNTTITDKKTLFTLNFAPSENITESRTVGDDNQNIYAKILLFDDDGSTNSIKDRILTQGAYTKTDNTRYLSGYFDEKQKFGSNSGLLKTYYSKFQLVLNRPIVATVYVYLQDYELTNFKEVYPVYINGVYYMPITVTVQTNGLATCELIKMPNT